MRRFTEILDHICVKAVCLIGILIFGALSYWAAFYTHYYAEDLSSEKVYVTHDFWLQNVLFAVLALVIAWLLQQLLLQGNDGQKKKRMRIITAAVIAVMGIGLCIWVSICHITPSHDQLQVIYAAREFMSGNYEQMQAYMYMYPQQYGLAFFYEILLKICDSYRFLQYLNVIFIMMIVGFGCLVAEELFHNQTVNLYCLLGFVFFSPLLLYVNFVYGEICSIALILAGTWCLLKWFSGGRLRYALIAPLCVAAATLVRKNSLIFLVALCIVLLVKGITGRNWRAGILALLIVTVSLLSVRLVQYSYEKRSGIAVGEGIPAVMWVAMGMQESWNGAGTYNAFNNSIFWGEAQGDSQAAAAIGNAYVRGRIKEFVENPRMAKSFYQDKLLQQWNEPSFGCLIMTCKFDRTPKQAVTEVYYGNMQKRLLYCMDRYLFLMYLMAVVCAVAFFLDKPDILKCVMLIAAIGGVLFSLLWEAKSRYVFPYVVMLIPYMAYGMYVVQRSLGAALHTLRRAGNGQTERDEEAA